MKHILAGYWVLLFIFVVSIQRANAVNVTFGNSSTTYTWSVRNVTGQPGPNVGVIVPRMSGWINRGRCI